MAELGALVEKVRSKNAGPFWLTVDVFCGDAARFAHVSAALSTARVAGAFGVAPEAVTRYDLADLAVLKFSLPRPATQGTVTDRDMHGAAWAVLVAELEIN